MPPNSKRRGLRSTFTGLRSLFSSSKERPRDEEPINLKMSTVEASPSNAHASVLLREPEEAMKSAATIGMVRSTSVAGSPSHGGVDPFATEGARTHPMMGAATTGVSNALGEGPQSHSDMGPSTAESAHRHSLPLTVQEHAQSMSIFPNSQKAYFHNVTFDSSQHVHNAQNSGKEGMLKCWKMLLRNIASNALHDSSARFDAPKCDEDTRVEVTKELMDWIEDREAPQRLLCVTGAAGAGKSALQQTIAENCSDSNILGSAFFFSAGDPTRNDLTHIVPTIACQLGLRNPALRSTIGKAIEEDPLIFKKTLKIQMHILVVTPFQHVCASGALDRNTFPHAILIDGLDECSGEDNQAELLSTIKHCLLDEDLPFRIFIASRPEWVIRSALDHDPEGYLYQLAYHIKLSDKYDATKDIRRYLWRRLRDIGSRTRDRRAQYPLWPTEEDIEKLVAAASGQFVYAATVVKYVSEHRSSPVDRLRTVIEWTPHDGQQTRPFEALDTLYRSILSIAKELYEAVDTNQGRDFVMLIRAHQINCHYRVDNARYSCHVFDEFLGLEGEACQVLFSDLHSLVFFRQNPVLSETWVELHFYHRSFSEFLDSTSRAQHLFVSEARVRQYVTESCLQKIVQREDFLNSASSFHNTVKVLAQYCDPQTTHVDDFQLIDFTRNDGWGRLDQGFTSGKLHLILPKNWARFTFDAFQRLRDELHEPELADIVESYFNKWEERYRERGFNKQDRQQAQGWHGSGNRRAPSHPS